MKPETNTSNLVARLQTFVESDSNPDDITTAGLRKEIKDLISTDPAMGYMVSGIYHCVFRHHEESLASHERSLKLSSESIVYSNYLTSLDTFGETTKAHSLALKAVDKHPDDISLVNYAARLSYKAGRLEEVMDFYDTYKKLTVNQEEIEPSELTDVITSTSRLLDKGIDSDEFSKVIEESTSVLLENKIMRISTQLFVHEGEFSCLVKTNASPEIAAKLNDDLCRRLSELKDFIVYSFTLIFTPAAAE